MKRPFIATAILMLGAFVLLPSLALAHDITPGAAFWGPILSCGQRDAGGVLDLCNDFCDVLHTVQHAIAFALTLVLYILGPLMILVGGGMYLISGASPDLRSKAKSTLTGALTGILIALCSYLIVATFLWILGNAPEGSSEPRVGWPNIECAIPAYVPPFTAGGVNPDFEPGGGEFGGGGSSSSW